VRPAGLVAAALVLLVAGGAVAGAASSKPPQGAAAARAQKLDRKVTGKLDRIFAATRDELIKLTKLSGVKAQDSTACNAEMTARETSPRYTAFGAANRAGDLYCLSIPQSSATSVADRAYFLEAIGSDGFAVGDFQVGRVSATKMVTAGYPTHGSDGKINGIVLAGLSLSFIRDSLRSALPKSAVDLLVIDDHGTVLARSGQVNTGPGVNLLSQPLVHSMVIDDHGTGSFKLAGKKVVSAWDTAPLSTGGTHVAVSVRP
jgi:hypothetical protein